MRPRRTKIASDDTGHDEYRVETAERSRDREPTTGRRLLRNPLVILGLGAVAAYALLALGLNVLVDTDQLRGWLEPRASATLNRPVSTGGARVALLPRPSIHVTDVRVDNLQDFDGATLAFVERVRLDVRVLPLLIGRVQVHRAHLDDARINLIVDETGTSNFGDLMPSEVRASEGLGAPVGMAIERVAMSAAAISYFNAPAGRSFTISDAEAFAELSPEGAAGWRAEIVAESDSLLARLTTLTDEILHLEGPKATLTAHSNGSDRWIDIRDGTLELSGETLSLNGRLTGLTSTRTSYDLQLTNDSMDAGVLTTLLPAGLRSSRVPALDGRLGVTLQVIGARSPGEPPLVQGSLRLDDVALHMSGQIMVDRVNGVIGVSPDTIVLDSLTGVFAEGPFELSGTVARDDRAVALRTHARPDLDALDRLGLVPEGATLSGDAGLDLSVAGRLDMLDSVDVAGSITLEGLQAKHARVGVPIYVPAGELTLLGREVSWTDLAVLVGQDGIVTSGRATGLVAPTEDVTELPRVQASVQGRHLDLGAVLPAASGRPEVSYGQVAFAHLGGHRLDGRPAATVISELGLSRPTSLPWRGELTLEVDTLVFRHYRMESVSARIELSDSAMVVEAPSFAMWGGDATAALSLGVGGDREEPFTLALTAEAVSAEDFLGALTPAGGAVSGTLNLNLDVAGTVDASLLPVGHDLSGLARLSIAEGRVHDTGPNLVVADFLGSPDWSDVSFASWDTEIALEARRLEVRRSELVSDQGRVAFDGLVHLDGSHDLSVGLSIPPDRLGTVSLRRTGIGQSVLDHLAEAGSSLDLGLRMSGVLGAPQLEPDASNAVALAR